MAPSISGLGARSEPIASTTMVTGSPLPRSRFSEENAARASALRRLSIMRERPFFLRGRRALCKGGPSFSGGADGLLGFDRDHFATLLLPTLRTSAVRHLALVTVGALGERLTGQMVMSAP